jgi:hypothetical protein
MSFWSSRSVAHPTPGRWMHHLEVRDVTELDDEVAGWLLDAAAAAGAHRQDDQSPL